MTILMRIYRTNLTSKYFKTLGGGGGGGGGWKRKYWETGSQYFLFFTHNVIKILDGIQLRDWIEKRLKPGWFNSLPNDKILDLSKFKAFADGKIILTQKLKFVLGKAEKNMGKWENAGYQHFLLFPQCFQKLSFPEVLKVGITW